MDEEYNNLWNIVEGELQGLLPSDRDLKGLNKTLRYHSVVEDATNYSLHIKEFVKTTRYREAFQHYENKIIAFEETRRARKEARKGRFLHVFNDKIIDWENYLTRFAGIGGEVCASDLKDNLHSYRRNTIGVILEGKATASFDFDCWSLLKSNGFRKATRGYNDWSLRSEHWIVPANCKIKALVMKKYDSVAAEAARNLNISIQYL